MQRTSISNYLIIISIFFTFLAFYHPWLYNFGMNSYFLNRWIYHIYFIQFFTSNFLHWWILHLLFNSIFIYYFWNIVELILWSKKYLIFFVFTAIFNGLLLTILSAWNTIWISWFAMAILAYYTLELKEQKNPEYNWWITALVINIVIWFHPQISLFWHLFWAIAWVIFYLINRKWLSRLMTPIKYNND